MNHSVFRDLAPNYIDNLTSEETNRLIEEHLKQCEDCRKYLDEMREDLLLEGNDEGKKEKRNIDYFKKVRSKNKKKTLTIVGSLLSVFVILFISFYIIVAHMWIADEADVEMVVKQQDNTITMTFNTNNNNRYILAVNTGKDIYNNDIVVYEKWNDFSEVSKLIKDGSNITYTFLDENTLLLPNDEEKTLTDEDKIYIKYKNNTEEIILKDLYNMKNKD